MDMALPIDAREVLFHLNYMGYRNITKEQLKSFMTDLKKLIRYESQPNTNQRQEKAQTAPHSINIERLFESHTKASLQKQKQHKLPDKPPVQEKNNVMKVKVTTDETNQNKEVKETKTIPSVDKENIPTTKADNHEEPPKTKSKMWIRPKSAQTSRPISAKKRTDPVALYQEYQKDWNRFKDNMCESSRSELRWQVREKLMSRQQ